ncbi:MAG: hypothetical protein ACR2GF_00085 [Acidimicrobiales bacterium]
MQARHRLAVTIHGDLVDVMDAVAAVSGRPAAEVATEWVIDGLRRSESDPDVAALVRARRRRQRRLRLIVGEV